MFILVKRYIKCFRGNTRTESWKYNGMSEEIIGNLSKLNSSFAQTFVDRHEF